MKDTTVDDVLKRLMIATGATKQASLAAKLDISSQAVYNSIKKGIIPATWITKASSTFGVSSDWILYGTGAMLRSNTEQECQETTERGDFETGTDLNKELIEERQERRELAKENRQLWKENGELRERVARLEEQSVQDIKRGTGIIDAPNSAHSARSSLQSSK